MIGISISFLSGRYHATPWGRHVNEGAVEWPPSPWRLLRSLVAVWKRTLPDEPQSGIEPILRALAGPPKFLLPPASTGHTRHYMPWFKKGPDARTLVFDAFVALAPEAQVIATWPEATLDEVQRDMLACLLANLNFLGRAESWCEARLLADDDDAFTLENDDVQWSYPIDVASPSSDRQGLELIRTLCPDPDSAFDDKHVVEVATVTQGRGRNKTTTQSRRAIYDPNWHLCMETLRLHDQKWSDPPGSRWIPYSRRRDCFELKPASRHPSVRARSTRAIHIARFALDSAVLPLVTETLPIAEAARRALMSLQGQLTERNGVRGSSSILAGKDEQGNPLAGHRHAYYLPTDEDDDGRLDHLTVCAAAGFGVDELRAFERLTLLNTGRDGEDRHQLRVLLLGTAHADDLRDGISFSPLGPASVWESVTPYLATRHAKTRGRDRIDLGDPNARAQFLAANLREQMHSARPDLAAGVIEQARIAPVLNKQGVFIIGHGRSPRTLRPLQFKRFRRKATDDGGRRLAGAFRITFSAPTRGPIALGHSAHFGLGLFLPSDSAASGG